MEPTDASDIPIASGYLKVTAIEVGVPPDDPNRCACNDPEWPHVHYTSGDSR